MVDSLTFKNKRTHARPFLRGYSFDLIVNYYMVTTLVFVDKKQPHPFIYLFLFKS
jgi:hypothetical protein